MSNFPKYKEVTWFIVVANSSTKEVLGLKRLSFKRFSSKSLVIVLPEDFNYEGIELYLMNDSYIGLD